MPTPSGLGGIGLEIFDHPNIVTNDMTFNLLNNGIIARRSSVDASGSTLLNILPDAGTSNPEQGYAILGLGSGVEKITYRSATLAPAGTVDIGGENSIYVSRMSLDVFKKRFNTLKNAVSINRCGGQSIKVIGNDMVCGVSGVNASNNPPFLQPNSVIQNNNIRLNSSSSTNAAVRIAENSNVLIPNIAAWRVLDNDLTLLSDGIGLRQSGGVYSDIRFNTIKFSTPNTIGIDLKGTLAPYINCNEVSHTTFASNVGRRGIQAEAVRVGNYTCNTLLGSNRAMDFKVLCDNSTLKGNDMGLSGKGLVLEEDVALGTQGLDFFDNNGQIVRIQDHGNIWASNSGGAQHNSLVPGIQLLSAFGVDPQENPDFLPANNGSDWFKPEPTPGVPSYYCAFCQPPPPPVAPPVDGRFLDKSIANGNILSYNMPGVSARMLENHLYARLRGDGVYAASDPLFQTFLNNKYGTTTQVFYEIEKGIDELHQFTAAEQATLDPLQNNINTFRVQLAYMDSLRAAGGTVNAAYYASLLSDLSAASNNLRTALGSIRSTHTTQANALLAQNDAIPVTEAWESAAREVNRFYLWAYIQNDVLNATQLNRLDQIASGCVALEGDALIRAQNLYNLFIEKEYVNTLDCLGPRENVLAKNMDSGVLSPNPTTGLVNLPGSQGVVQFVQVLDLNGKLVFETKANGTTLDLGQLPNGLYFVRISVEGNNSVSKLTIQH